MVMLLLAGEIVCHSVAALVLSCVNMWMCGFQIVFRSAWPIEMWWESVKGIICWFQHLLQDRLTKIVITRIAFRTLRYQLPKYTWFFFTSRSVHYIPGRLMKMLKQTPYCSVKESDWFCPSLDQKLMWSLVVCVCNLADKQTDRHRWKHNLIISIVFTESQQKDKKEKPPTCLKYWWKTKILMHIIYVGNICFYQQH